MGLPKRIRDRDVLSTSWVPGFVLSTDGFFLKIHPSLK